MSRFIKAFLMGLAIFTVGDAIMILIGYALSLHNAVAGLLMGAVVGIAAFCIPYAWYLNGSDW